MARVFLIEAFLFLLPLILYGGYLYLIKRKQDREGARWKNAPYLWLILGGFGFMAAGMLVMAYLSGEDPAGAYVPAHMENGRIVPGEVK